MTQKFVYGDGLRPIAQLAPDDSVVHQFLYGERSSVPSLIVDSSSTYRVVADYNGSPRAIIDIGSGTTVQYLKYDEFGYVTTDTNGGFQPYGFAGGLYDPDTKLVHFGAREYDPLLGRFLTRDPLGFGGGQLNVYDYAANDPVNFTDPSGLLFHNEFQIDAGEETGAELLEVSADILTNPKASVGAKARALVSAIGGALWSPCTSDATLQTVAQAVFALATVGGGVTVAADEAEVATGFHATNPANVESILENGLRESSGGRLGAGVYVSDSPEGALAEYLAHNPEGPAPTILTVEYNPGLNYTLETPAGMTQGPLPLAADTISAESARLPGAVNTVIRNGSATVTR